MSKTRAKPDQAKLETVEPDVPGLDGAPARPQITVGGGGAASVTMTVDTVPEAPMPQGADRIVDDPAADDLIRPGDARAGDVDPLSGLQPSYSDGARLEGEPSYRPSEAEARKEVMEIAREWLGYEDPTATPTSSVEGPTTDDPLRNMAATNEKRQIERENKEWEDMVDSSLELTDTPYSDLRSAEDAEHEPTHMARPTDVPAAAGSNAVRDYEAAQADIARNVGVGIIDATNRPPGARPPDLASIRLGGKDGEIAPETPDDILGHGAKDALTTRPLDVRIPPWTILQYRIWKAVSSWNVPTRIAAAAVPVAAAAVVAASISVGGGTPQVAAPPGQAAASPTILVNLQPPPATPAPTRTARPAITPSPVGSQRNVVVYVRLGGHSRDGCPAPGSVKHEDWAVLTVTNPAPGAFDLYPLQPWTHPRCGGTSFGLADSATPAIGAGAPEFLPGFESPLFRPDTTYSFENTEQDCAGNTCVHKFHLRVWNRSAPGP